MHQTNCVISLFLSDNLVHQDRFAFFQSAWGRSFPWLHYNEGTESVVESLKSCTAAQRVLVGSCHHNEIDTCDASYKCYWQKDVHFAEDEEILALYNDTAMC